jgi:serine phosphatase RsbU (regulator of sigma subunit)
MGPALLMTLSSTLIRTYAEEMVEQPDQLLKVTNQRILKDVNAGMFVTLFYGVLDPASGQLVYSNAGQTPPYLLDEQNLISLDRTGMALGIAEEEAWDKRVLQIPPGATLVLYTDGVMDIQNRVGDQFGRDHLRRVLKQHQNLPAQQLQEALLREIYQFTDATSRMDDITLMVLVRDR